MIYSHSLFLGFIHLHLKIEYDRLKLVKVDKENLNWYVALDLKHVPLNDSRL